MTAELCGGVSDVGAAGAETRDAGPDGMEAGGMGGGGMSDCPPGMGRGAAPLGAARFAFGPGGGLDPLNGSELTKRCIAPTNEFSWAAAGADQDTTIASAAPQAPRGVPIERASPLIMDWCLRQNLGQFHAEPRGIAASSRSPAHGDHAMPDALDLLKTRRSVKPNELLGPAPSEAETELLLTIASRVPDHGKLAPWRFIVFTGDARLRAGEAIAAAFVAKYPDATVEQIAMEASRLARAPLVIAVVSRAAPHAKIPEWEQVLSSGAAAMNLLNAVYALGFGATWITEWYAYDRAVLAALGLDPHEKITGFVHIGRIDRRPEDRARPPLADIVTRF